MTRPTTVVAVLASALLVSGATLIVTTHGGAAPQAAPTVAAPGSAPRQQPSTTTTTRTAARKGPPSGSIQLPQRYVDHYDAKRVDWNDVLAHGRAMPKVTEACAASWKKSGKDPDLDWSRAHYWCLDGLPGAGYRPQGAAGSGTTQRYTIGGAKASKRNIVLTTWYSRKKEKGLFAGNHSGESVTRLVVMDVDRGRYNIVELVKPSGRHKLRNLNSHGSGLAWAGQYLYSSTLSSLWMYNADDLLKIDGHYVLPAVSRWAVGKGGGLSSISIARTSGQDQLKTINYTRSGTTYVHGFGLDRHGLITSGEKLPGRLELRNRFGEHRRVVRSAGTSVVPGDHYQGIGRLKPYTFVNSSALRLGGPTSRHVDAMVVLRDGEVIKRFQMPEGNVESVYIDYGRGTYTSLTEHGSRFLFTMPLSHLVRQASR